MTTGSSVPPLSITDGLQNFTPQELRSLRDEFQQFLLEYRFGMQEIETKLQILRDEFQQLHD
ncbi:MAG: pyrophosphokinae, partial [Microbacterium sp.]|nr:pyrophosphokinae [Microbacterium sp.]